MNFLDFTQTVVDVSTYSVAISTRPTVVRGVYINTVLSAHTVVIKSVTTAIYTFPASSAAGTYFEFGDTTFANGLVVDPNDSSTGNITIEYKVL